MCGIAGYLNLDGAPASSKIARRMADAVAHRGPDGEGYWAEGNAAFGHRRLAIIDLTPAAAQPMVSADGNFVLIYNGEIYNFRQIRAELETLGVRFQSSSDTEVVLEAFAQWGTAALERFNGMFALAIWNRRERRLLLARDRYGVKPLYYGWFGQTLAFGSEVKALLAHPGAASKLDLESLLEYMTFQNFLSDRTLFKGIRVLPAGSWMIVDCNARSHNIERYWDFDFVEPDGGISDNDYVEELQRLFEQAVSRQLVSDVPVATYLSGGIDSGSITALAARQVPHLRSFTVGFDIRSASGLELQFDERESAEYMSYLFGTEHYEMVLKAGDMVRCLPDMCRHIEEPRVGQSYPNYYAAKLVSRFDKVVLTGVGGDELFAGYPWRYYRSNERSDFDHYIDAYYEHWHRLVPNKSIREVFAPVWKDVSHVWTRDIFRDVFADRNHDLLRPVDYINHSLYFEAKTFMHGLLMVEDKLSMAHGLESRVPFLDNDLVDFATKLPMRLKIGQLGPIDPVNENEIGPKSERYFARTGDGKLILRNVLSRYVPPEITSRKKQGFSAPDASWFRGESIDYVRRTLYEGNPRIYEVFDRKAIQALLDEHLQGRQNRRLLIWSLLSLEHSFRTFFP
jgi:asparagine synthase (glutamine-hydrolysing)